ncbi:MAG: ABC transporter permease, partial [Pseudolysinimonas sp.]
MTERWDARRLLSRRFRTRPAASVLVGVLTLLTVVLAAVVPRLVEQQATAELEYQLQSIGTVGRSLQGSGDFPEDWDSQPPPDLGQLYSGLQDEFDLTRQQYDEPLRGLVGAPQWIVQTPVLRTAPVGGSIQRLGVRLTADPSYLKQIRIVQGVAPSTWTTNDVLPSEETRQTPVDVLLSAQASASLKLTVGTLIGGGVPDRLYRVSGLFEPSHPAADYWQQNPSLLPVSTLVDDRNVEYPSVSAFVDPLSVGRLGTTFGTAQVSLFYPVAATGADGADAELLLEQLSAAVASGAAMPSGETRMPLVTLSDGAVETAVQRGSLLTGLLALLAAAPLGLLVAVLVLGVQGVVRARRSDLTLAAARGGSVLQLRGVMALEGALLAVPAAAVVTLLATILLPVRAEPAGFVLPALVALLPPILYAALAETEHSPGSERSLLTQLRGVAELCVIVLAGLSLFLLARRGLAQASAAVGVDPLLSVAPLLLAVSVGIIVLRGYPLPMRAARRVATRGVGLVAFVGAIRATRVPTIGLAGVLALVVGISVSLFSGVLLTTFDAGIARAAAESVGADARVDGTAITPAQRSAVAAIEGVREVAGIQYLASLAVSGPKIDDTVTLLVAQTAPLATLRHLPTGLGSDAGDRVPVVVSSDLLKQFGSARTATIGGVNVRVVGSLPAESHLGPSSEWVLVDATFAPRFHTQFTPETLFIAADPDRLPQLAVPLQRAVGADPAEVTSTATVTTVTQAKADRDGEPVVAGVRAGLVLAAGLSVLLCALALVLATVAAAEARGRTAGILRTLGMPRRRLGVLIAWELVPVAAVALVTGAALGIALPFVVNFAVDLRP